MMHQIMMLQGIVRKSESAGSIKVEYLISYLLLRYDITVIFEGYTTYNVYMADNLKHPPSIDS